MVRTAAYLLLIGFVIVLIASAVGPGEVYSESDPQARLDIIRANRGPWVLSNLLFGLGAVVTAAGLLAAWSALGGRTAALPAALGAIAYTGGALAWFVYLVQRMNNPAAYLYVEPMPVALALFGLLTVTGLLLFGYGWLRATWPAWPGYLMLVGNGLIAAGAFMFPARFYAGFPPQVFYLFTLLAGIALWREKSIAFQDVK